jgi:protein O-GlcNAc transferase
MIVLQQLKPNFCDAWSNLASAYMRKAMLQEAAECCRHALSLNPRLVRYTKASMQDCWFVLGL